MRTHAPLAAAALLAAACHGTTRPVAAPLPAPAAVSATLAPDEARLRDAVRAHYDESVALLQRTVDVPSGTLNLAGVRKVGDIFAKELESLGFESRWVALPDSL